MNFSVCSMNFSVCSVNFSVCSTQAANLAGPADLLQAAWEGLCM